MSTSKVVYRNAAGCCICRTKSSSSRFTNSRRYENAFEACFLVSSKERSGWICNSCVLIVKRFRKNPHKPTGIRDWSHKIDSRVGPGSKPKSFRKPPTVKSSSSSKSKTSSSGVKKTVPHKMIQNCSPDSDDDYCTWKIGGLKRKAYQVKRYGTLRRPLEPRSFIDREYYQRLVTCCGEEYVGRNRDVLAAVQPDRVCRQQPCALWSSLLSVCSALRASEMLRVPAIGNSISSSQPISRSSEPDMNGAEPVVINQKSSLSDQTTLLLRHVSACLSGLDNSSDDGRSLGSLVKLGSTETSGIQSRGSSSDLGDSPPMSVQSRTSDEEL